MSIDLVLASNNKGKIRELQLLLPSFIHLHSLEESGITEEIAEPFYSFAENAMAKTQYVAEVTGKNALADDSGLVVSALDGAPGVKSARYCGRHGDDLANMELLLRNMEGIADRQAYFFTDICLFWKDEYIHFTGKCEGHIAEKMSGSHGFGYDPVFIPEGYDETFASLPQAVKNKISHRAKAVADLLDFVKVNMTDKETAGQANQKLK